MISALSKLVPVEEPKQDRVAGLHADQIRIEEDFDAPLPEDVLESFER
jgi:hypothetical protein